MVRTEEVSLRRPKVTGTQQVSFRLTAEVIAYYEAEAQATSRTKVEVVQDALVLDRDLGRRLAPVRARLEQAATAMGLNLDFDLAEVLSKLVEIGLDTVGGIKVEYEKGQRK